MYLARRQIGLLCFLVILILSGCGQVADTSGLSGTYTLVYAESDGVVLPADLTEALQLYFRLDPGGTGELFNADTDGRLRWQLQDDVLTVWAGGRTMTGTVRGNTLCLEDAETASILWFSPEWTVSAESDAVSEEIFDNWVGDWYGWWKIENSDQDMPTSWYDCCAVISREGSLLRFVLWDEDGSFDAPLADLLLIPDEEGELVSLNGFFFGETLHHGDWRPRMNDGAVFLDRQNYRGNGEAFQYSIYLRPWGDVWAGLDTQQLPFYYEDWYLPMLESETEMPRKIPWEELEAARMFP